MLKRRRRSLLACLLGVALAFPAPLLAAPITMERELGEEFVREARRAIPLIYEYELDAFVNSIGYRFVGVLGKQPFDYQFFVVNDDSINAFAVPGGKIFVNAGLISRAANEAELAGVIGHEIAHAHAHHSVRQQEKGAAASYAGLLGMFLMIVNPVLGSAAMSAAMGQQLKYQRDFEREADFLGIDLAKKAGYDPGSMLGLLRKIYEEQQVNPTVVPPYFLSHPLTGERMSYLEAALGKSEWDVKKAPPTFEYERVQAIARANCQTRRQAVPPYERRVAEAKPGKEHTDAVELLGVLMSYGGEYEPAVKNLELARKDGRDVDRALGRAYLRTGKVDEALKLLEPAVAANPGDWSAAADLGEAYYQKGDFAKAVSMLTKSNDLQPYRPELMRTLGRALDKTGRRGAGFYYFAQAAEFQGDAVQALAYYTKASQAMGPDDPLRADTEQRMKDLEDAKPPVPPGPPNGGRAQRPPR